MSINWEAFTEQSPIELGDKIIKIVSIGEKIGQLLQVDCESFLKSINAKHVNANYDGDIPETAILKIFDSDWGNTHVRSWEKIPYKLTYQFALDFEAKELEAYERLSSLVGDVLPQLYAYGQLADIQVSVGVPYVRFSGPFLLMEQFEKDEEFTVTEEYLENVIIPLFQKIHDLNIIHNDPCVQTMIITKTKEFKLINFKFSKYSEDAKEKEDELRFVRSCFFGPNAGSIYYRNDENMMNFIEERADSYRH